MKKANLAVGNAIVPLEEAHQPLNSIQEENMTPKATGHSTKKHITFADDTDNETPSQNISSSYKDVLSQPATDLSHRQKLEWLQKRRTCGLWAQCDDCSRFRFLPDVLDSYELPAKWYCHMNPDPDMANCSVPETPIPVYAEEDMIHGEYSAGSVVWARVSPWPWWPAMVDDCPDAEQYYWIDAFSDIPTHYNVVFFDSDDVTRHWVKPECLKPYTAYKDTLQSLTKLKTYERKYKNRMRDAMKQADDAVKLPLAQRLKKYSFLTRYKGAINTPKKNKKELKKHQKNLKKKFNIEFEMESDEELPTEPKPKSRKRNMIILGTPKNKRARALSIVMDKDELDALLASDTETVQETAEPTANRSEMSVEIEKVEMEPNTEASTDTKNANSLVAQVGSESAPATVEEAFDDDTSKTYVPDKESVDSTQPTQTTDTFFKEFRVEMSDSPSSFHSDDFEY